MRLCDICSAPCFPSAPDFELPAPGSPPNSFKFGTEKDRDFYAVLLNNHPPQVRAMLNPKIAIVGLSPASKQISEFVRSYGLTRDYGEASVAGTFAGGLAEDIIAMMRGLGLASKLGIEFPRATLARHPDVYVTSLVACATLTTGLGSDAFDPLKYKSAERCIADRFVQEMLSPNFRQMRAVLILGGHGWAAISNASTPSRKTVLEELRSTGRLVMQLPHPSGSNREYVRLASMEPSDFPARDDYVGNCWNVYKLTGKAKQTEVVYKNRRRSGWTTISELRRRIGRL